jgi:hypothetical protein
MDVKYLKEMFPNYLNKLIRIIYQPRQTFEVIFHQEEKPFVTGLLFAMVSVFISLSILFMANELELIDIKMKSESLTKQTSLIVFQILILIPIMGGFIHLFCKLFRGSGDIFTTIILYMYSYAIAPYSTVLYVFFLIIEGLVGKPVLFGLPENEVLKIIELVSEALFLIYGSYIMLRGIQVGHKMSFSRAFSTLVALAITAIGIGSLSKLAYIKYINS